jgi:hypothetical protein
MYGNTRFLLLGIMFCLLVCVDGRIILRWIFKKWDAGIWIRLSWLWIEIGGENL